MKKTIFHPVKIQLENMFSLSLDFNGTIDAVIMLRFGEV